MATGIERLRSAFRPGRPALVAYVPIGDPDAFDARTLDAYREAGVDGATAAPPAAEMTALTSPKRGPDADGDFVVKVKVGKGQPTTVVRLIEDGSVIGRVYRSVDGERVVEFPVTDAAPGEHRYSVELENSAGTTDGGVLVVHVAG